MAQRKTSKLEQWADKNIAEVRAQVKSQIEARLSNSSPDEVGEFIMEQIALQISQSERAVGIHAYIWMMSALVHHVRHGSFKPAQINRLFDDAVDLLKLNGIAAESPRLGVLVSDLFAVMSQIFHTQGSPWSAFWYQQLAVRSIKGSKDRDKAHQAFAFAIRAIRFGMGDVADRELSFAESNHKNQRERCKARLHRIKLARLCANWDKFKELSEEFKSWSPAEDSFAHELEWETICVTSILEQDAGIVRRAIQKAGSHYQAVYVVEGRLRLLAQSSFKEHDKLAKLSTLSSDSSLGINRLGDAFKALSVLEQSYDELIPISTRFESIGRVMSRLNLLGTYEQEMLFLGCAVRWLSRNGHIPLAEVCLKELEFRSLRFSNGDCRDSLGCMSDLMQRNWFKQAS